MVMQSLTLSGISPPRRMAMAMVTRSYQLNKLLAALSQVLFDLFRFRMVF